MDASGGRSRSADAREQLRHHGLTDFDRILIRDRLPAICGDNVSMNSVLADDVQNISSQTYLMTHTTNPLLSASTIRCALDQYRQGLAEGCNDSLFTVNRFQTRFYRNDGSPINHDPKQLLRTQDLLHLLTRVGDTMVFEISVHVAFRAEPLW